MSSNKSHITLPLDTLFALLEAAGFEVSPDARVRAWRVLSTIGRDAALTDAARLKLLLAPVFARSAEEQKRFYEVFDRYAEDLKKTPAPPPPPPSFWEKVRSVLKSQWLYGVLAITLGMAWAAYQWGYLLRYDTFPMPELEMSRAVVGDTVHCKNLTNTDGFKPGELVFEWKLVRQTDEDTVTVLQAAGDTAWQFVTPAPKAGEQWQVELAIFFKDRRKGISRTSDEEGGSMYSFKNASKGIVDAVVKVVKFQPFCKTPPAIPRLRIPSGKLQAGKRITFGLADKPKPGHRYYWTLPGRADTAATTVQFTPENNGNFSIRLSVADTTQAGQCAADTTFTLQVGETLVRLPYLPLYYDRTPPRLVFGWGIWLLLALLSAAAAWYWRRWLLRQPLPPETPVAPSVGKAPDIKSGDKPPYYIPFRDPKGALRTAREQYRLADAMRLRQQTDDLVLDLQATLLATLDRGGFPTLRYRHRTRPAEYLFLVDEQMPGRHLARLFRHLAETLHGQDVHLDLVWCDAGLLHFRAPALPPGLSLDGLRRHFPQHRLVILGTAQALLDDGAPQLRDGAKPALNGWPQRLLLSPRPVADWDWREAVLYRHFGLFPADLRGLLDAAAFVENGLDTEDMPAEFAEWKAVQQALRHADPAMEYRNWRTLADHEEYLAPYGPALRRWFLAVAVHPTPNWEITIAIARRLGIAPTHDRLLALSRLPALRDGHLHPALRRDMLRALDADTEATARHAVLAELEAIRHLTEGSHVAEETEIFIAVQAFLLEPGNDANRDALAALLNAGMLGRPLEMELDLFVEKQLARRESETDPLWRKKMEDRPAKIREWLAATRPDAPPPPKLRKPFFTPDFHRAAAFTAAALLSALLGWMACRSGSFVQQALVNEAYTPGRDQLRHFVLLKEDMQTDSAMIYNNLGALSDELIAPANTPVPTDSLRAALVQLRRNLAGPAANNAAIQTWYKLLDSTNIREIFRVGPPEAYPAQDALFEYAQSLKPGYPLARQNQARNAANHAAALLEQYRSRPDSLYLAYRRFADAADLAGDAFPAERRYAQHGQGVTQYYAGKRDAALALYDTLLTAGYFDTLKLRPNLETLLFGNGACYTVANVNASVGFRTRELSVQELNTINADPGGPLAKETLLGTIPLGQTVTVLDSSRYFWRVRYQRRIGYVAKLVRNQPGLLPCDAPVQRPQAPDAAAPNLAAVIAAIARDMVWVQGGTFRMGCTEEQGEDCSDDENPPHDVELSDYRIGRTEVTVAQYMAFVEDTKTHYPEWLEPRSDYNINTGTDDHYKRLGSALQEPNHPIVGISWNDAVAFCDWLSKKTGTTYRLPTEAEWEYAARGGRKAGRQYKYAGSDDIGAVAWYDDNSGDKTQAVGRKKPNDLGLYDMSGNVWEWCADWYGDYEDTGKPQVNPRGPEQGDYRVLRGGGWGGYARGCLVSHRDFGTPGYRGNFLGFRLVSSPRR